MSFSPITTVLWLITSQRLFRNSENIISQSRLINISLGNHLNARDAKAVRKTVSGYVKLLHPDGNYTKDEVREYLGIALEGRRRVKEQLKKMLSFEYSQTTFSFLDHETQEESFIGVPEEGGRDLIVQDPLPPGTAYTTFVSNEGKAALYRIEVGLAAGTRS